MRLFYANYRYLLVTFLLCSNPIVIAPCVCYHHTILLNELEYPYITYNNIFYFESYVIATLRYTTNEIE